MTGRTPARFARTTASRASVARRIDHPDQAGEHEIPFEMLADVRGAERPVRRGAVANPERAQRAGRQRIVRLENLTSPVVGQRPVLRSDVLVCAPRQQQVRGAFREHQDAAFSFGVRVNGAHQLAFSRER